MLAFGAIGPKAAILPIGATPKLRPREVYIQRLARINMRARRQGWDTMKLMHQMHIAQVRMEKFNKRHRLPVRWVRLWTQQYRGLELWRDMSPWQIYKLMWAQAYQRERRAARLGA
jgi:hypothetical protein